jgi:hypothetical protein
MEQALAEHKASQLKKLGIPFAPQKVFLRKHDAIRELRKYLPRDYWPAIEGLLK